MALGDGKEEEQDARKWKSCLDGIYIELDCIMTDQERTKHKVFKYATDKYMFTYESNAQSPRNDEKWWDDLEQWHLELMRLIQKKGLNFMENPDNKQDAETILNRNDSKV